MSEKVIVIGVVVLAAVVVVALVLVLVLVLRRRSRAGYAEPVVRRIDLASSAPASVPGASEAPAAPATPAADATPTTAMPIRPADPIAPAARPMAPILHYDTVQLTPLRPVTPANPDAPLPGPAFDGAQPDPDETVIVRPAASVPDPRLTATDATILSARRRSLWHLETQYGQRVPLPSPMCIVGRRPSPVATHPSASLVTVDDPGKTVSGTHALFELVDDAWLVTDLDSTNGVVVVVGGFETAIPGRTRTVIEGDFFLGDLGVRFVRES